MQLTMEKLGATCFHSPKFHCELTGEGIEYSWGNAKVKYWKICMVDKNTERKFHERVSECLSRGHLTTDLVGNNSKRARDYMVSYFITATNRKEGDDAAVMRVDEMKPCAISRQRIEQMKRVVKMHRAAIDFDTSLCSCTVHLKRED